MNKAPRHSEQLQQALDAIDEKNQQDPNRVEHQGRKVAKEHLYALRMSQHLLQFQPQASEHLQIACRAQHIQRWSRPRADYPMDRAGYKRWRTELAKFHAETTEQLMADCAYGEKDRRRVSSLLQKKQLKHDLEAQTLEDVACLVFLEHHLENFAQKHSEKKLIDIIRKTWNKMSDEGHRAALKLPLSEGMSILVSKALNA